MSALDSRQPASSVPRPLLAALGVLFALIVVSLIEARTQPRGPLNGVRAARVTAAHGGWIDTTVYGAGIQTKVSNPVSALRGPLGTRWRRLGSKPGRITAHPLGRRAPYFFIGLVAARTTTPARLEVLTSSGERGLAAVGVQGQFTVLNFGPFRAPQRRRYIGLALTTVALESKSQGRPIDISPISARYLQPGEAILRQDALRSSGPKGANGLELQSGEQAKLTVTPGVTGPVDVVVRAVALGRPAPIAVRLGHTTRVAQLRSDLRTIRLHGFRARKGQHPQVGIEPSANHTARLILSSLRLAHLRPR